MPSAMEQPSSSVQTFVDYYAAPEGQPKEELGFEEQYGDKSVSHYPINLKDMRTGSFNLVQNGFELVPLYSNMKVSDYSDIDTIKAKYFPEVAASVEKATGASKVYVVLPKVRNTDLQKKDFERGWNKNSGPIRRSHVDFNRDGKEEGITKLFGAEFMASIDGRWKLYNAWKPIKRVERDPLAMCDRVPEEDLVPVLRSVPGKTVKEGRYMVKAGAKDHDWYFASEQRPDELLIFCQYSDMEGAGPQDRVAHASVVLPGTEEKPARESVEVRALAVWD